MGNNAVCKYCNSPSVVKYGKVEGVQRYFCKTCRRKFTPDDSLFGMKTPANQVSSALDMYYKGMSLNEIREHLQQEYGNTPSSSTVFQWVEKYTDEATQACSEYQPKVGDTWVADETYVRIDRHSKGVQVDNPYSKSKKAKWIIFWDIIDADTRFLLASHITTTRNKEDAQALMEKAAARAGKSPKVVVTDKLASYLDGIELAFGGDTKHKQSSPFEVKSDNNLIERLHGTLKQRTKVMRGLKSIESAIQFVDGYLAYYNFLRPHEALDGRTPAEAAEISCPTKTWVDVARNADTEVEVLVTPQKTVVISELEPLVRPITHRHYKANRSRLRKWKPPTEARVSLAGIRKSGK